MAQREATTEANKGGSVVAKRGKHSSSALRLPLVSTPKIVRRPPQYSDHDLDLLLEVFFTMFTETQARKLRVVLPWDESDDPETMLLGEVAALIESWLEA